MFKNILIFLLTLGLLAMSYFFYIDTAHPLNKQLNLSVKAEKMLRDYGVKIKKDGLKTSKNFYRFQNVTSAYADVAEGNTVRIDISSSDKDYDDVLLISRFKILLNGVEIEKNWKYKQ